MRFLLWTRRKDNALKIKARLKSQNIQYVRVVKRHTVAGSGYAIYISGKNSTGKIKY